MQNARRTALCLTLLFLIAPMMPLATAAFTDYESEIEVKEPTPSYVEPFLKSIDAHPLKSLELLAPKVGTSSGRAACPSPSTLQSDGGSSGDAGSRTVTQ